MYNQRLTSNDSHEPHQSYSGVMIENVLHTYPTAAKEPQGETFCLHIFVNAISNGLECVWLGLVQALQRSHLSNIPSGYPSGCYP